MNTLIHTRQSACVSVAVFFIGLLVGIGIIASAQTNDPFFDIEYPIVELGGCGSETECMAYCDEITHLDACILFAENNGLMSAEEVEEAKKFAAAGGIGPGGCSSRQSCEAYCSNVANIDECIAFGETHGLIPEAELAEAKKVAQALREGAVLPGGCTSKDACEAYCSDPDHTEECILFAEAAGFMDDEELAEAKKFMEFVKQGGHTPGDCRGERQCMEYCDNPDHFDECILFAEEAGFISSEEAAMARKTGGKGPGGCVRDECETYCNDPLHQEECFAFATEHGLLSEDDLERVRDGARSMGEALQNAPPEALACLKEALGQDILLKIESGEPFTPSPHIGEKMRHCFETVGPPPDDLIHSIENAPPEVRVCIETRLGADVISRLRSDGFGALTSPAAGDDIRSCFEEFGGFGGAFDGDPHGGPPGPVGFDIFEEANPQVLGCLSTELGYERFVLLRDADEPPTLEDKAAMQRCFENTGFETPETLLHDVSLPPPPAPVNYDGFHDGASSGFNVPTLEPGIKECVYEKLGADFNDRIAAGDLAPSVIETVIRACSESYYRSGAESNIKQQFTDPYDTGSAENTYTIEPEGTSAPLPGVFPTLSPDIEFCVALKLGYDYKERLFAGELSKDAIDPAIRTCTEGTFQSDEIQSGLPAEASAQAGLRAFITNAWSAFLKLLE